MSDAIVKLGIVKENDGYLCEPRQKWKMKDYNVQKKVEVEEMENGREKKQQCRHFGGLGD